MYNTSRTPINYGEKYFQGSSNTHMLETRFFSRQPALTACESPPSHNFYMGDTRSIVVVSYYKDSVIE